MLTESDLRDQLANQLEILEAGLTFLAKEHRLANPFGSKGFIDILAKDRFGNRVIIEIKRSDKTARQALHEILKYVALFTATEGFSPSRIRCFIVSTEWHELLTPFAEFLSVANFQAEGFRLHVDAQGIVKSEPIAVPSLPAPVSPFRLHGAFFFQDSNDRDRSLHVLRTALQHAGAASFVLLAFDYNGPSPAVVFPYCAYIVPIELREEVVRELVAQKAEEYEVDSEEELEIEDVFHERLSAMTPDFYEMFEQGLTYEVGYPEKVVGMLDSGWRCQRTTREGKFGPVAADDLEIVKLISGTEGQNEIRFHRMSSPKFAVDWKEIREKSKKSLEGNNAWNKAFLWFHERVGRSFPAATFSASIYNPQKFPISLYKMAAYGDVRFLPQFELVAVNEAMQEIEVVLGVLLWDGKTIPSQFDSMIKRICEGIEEYLFQIQFGVAWQLDEAILAEHGLRYAAF
ncbi:MAG: endonuclease NucS domain-containing protein, partial [Planctomycetaceae bacterium]